MINKVFFRNILILIVLIVGFSNSKLKGQTLKDSRVVVKLQKPTINSSLHSITFEELLDEVKPTSTIKSNPSSNNLILTRMYPYAGKYEDRHKKYGLDLWYYARSASHEQPEDIKKVLLETNLFELVEIEPRFELNDSPQIKDSLFNRQWHLQNLGQSGGRKGADIGIVNALKIERGKKDIIISIHDSGIDYNHSDVIKNLWVNEGEIPDNGLDDDNNGYIDDIHGFNFVYKTNNLGDRNGHGTAIAGIIGAKSDDEGILGIAGGNSDDTGVRLMICRLDTDYEDLNIINPQESLVYAADNGSIISSNSWGSFGRSNTILSAMEYYAAVTGNEYMNTGLIVFSAGNNTSTTERYEKENPNVMSIASTDHNDKLSSFSNYGSWIDLCAPGEDVYTHYINGEYGLRSGTSFSAPILAASAGLVLSKFGHANYTLDSLRNRLLESADNIDEFNSGKQGRLGAGRLNVFKALLNPENEPPNTPTNFWIKNEAYFADLGIITPFDNTIAPFKYSVQLRSSDLDTSSLFFEVLFPFEGDSINFKLDSLKPNTEYALNVKSHDYFNNQSGWSDTVKFITKGRPRLEVENFTNLLSLDRGSSSKSTFSIKNTGDARLSWTLKDIVSDLKFDGIKCKISSSNYDEISDLIILNGGDVEILENTFFESDILGIHLIILDDRIENYDSLQISYLQNWIKNGGKLIIGVDAGGIGNANRLLNSTGIEYIPYEDTNYSYLYEISSIHPLMENVRELYLYFYKAYLSVSSEIADIVLLDEHGNEHIAVTHFGQGEVIVIANQIFQDFQFNNLDNEIVNENFIDYLLRKVRFTSESDMFGLLDSGESTSLSIEFNKNLGPNYSGELYIETDDYENPLEVLPYQLLVTGEPRSILKSDSILFDTTYVGYSTKKSFFVINGGTDNMEVSYLSEFEYHAFSNSGSSFTLEPGDTIKTIITFTPTTTNHYFEKLLIDCSDSVRSIWGGGYGLIPPNLETSNDTLSVSSLDVSEAFKVLEISNSENTSQLRYQWKLIQSERSLEWTPYDTSKFEGKVIGITGLNNYESKINLHPFASRNGIVDVKTPLKNNSFELDSLDVLILDERLWRLTKANATEINQWIEQGGLLFFQTDQIFDQEKFDKIFANTAITNVRKSSSFKTDSLTSIFYHPITEGVTSIWSRSSNASIETSKTKNVLIENIEGKPFLMWDQFGEGKIIAFSDQVFHNLTTDSLFIRLIDQCFKWLFNENELWVSINGAEKGALEEGESASFDILVNPILNQRREAVMRFNSNDPDSTKTIVIYMDGEDFSNNAPTSLWKSILVNENVENNSIIDLLDASDKEGDKIVFANTVRTHESLFVSPIGELMIVDSSFYDFELITQLSSEVLLTDGKDTTIALVTIEISNINEPPVLNDTLVIVAENEPINSVVGHLSVIDPENDILEISISSNDYFLLNNNGDLIVKRLLDFDQNSSFDFTISVSDGEFFNESTLAITIDQVLTLEQNLLPFIYPNPVERYISISEKYKYGLLFDVSGKILLRFDGGQIDLKSIDSGVHFLKLFYNDGTEKAFKLIKQ